MTDRVIDIICYDSLQNFVFYPKNTRILKQFTEQEFTVLMIASVAIMSVLALSLMLFFIFSQKKIFKEKMNNQRLKVKHQHNLLTSRIETEEKERNRIARELHDELGSKLGILHLNIDRLTKSTSLSTDSQNILHNIQSVVNESIGTVRRISHDLMPPILDAFGFKAAIEELCASINQSNLMLISCENLEQVHFREKFHEVNVYRILQELINNSRKHGKAKNIEIIFLEEDHGQKMIYRDDGIGMPLEKWTQSKGLGLRNIESRLQILGGSVKINEEKERGIELIFNL